MWPLSRQATKTKAKVRRFSRPDGYLVYFGEAAGRERCQAIHRRQEQGFVRGASL